MYNRLVAAALVAAAGSTARVQATVITQRMDEASEHGRAQMVLRASRATPNVIAAWQHSVDSTTTQVYYNVSTNGYLFRSDPGLITLPVGTTEDRGTKPMAFGSDGFWWVGYMGYAKDRFLIAPRAAGSPPQSHAGTAVETDLSGQLVDDGVLAAGPPEGGGSEFLGLAFNRRPNEPESTAHARAMISPPSASDYPIGNDDTTVNNPGNVMGPSGAIILRNTLAPELEGRWVAAAFARTNENLLRARAAWSDHRQRFI
jgi:hypothetical protein